MLEAVEATLLVTFIRAGFGNGDLGSTLVSGWAASTKLIVPVL
jgi:hypothetical protein